MSLADIAVLVALLIAVLFGWKTGFISAVLSFVGLAAVGYYTSRHAPDWVAGFDLPPPADTWAALCIVLAACVVAQGIGAGVGSLIRDKLSWEPARAVDSIAGAAVNAAGVLIVTWLVMSSAAVIPVASVKEAIAASKAYPLIDTYMPAALKDAVRSMQSLLGAGQIPAVKPVKVEGSGTLQAPPKSVAGTKATQTGDRVVKVLGDADGCGTVVMGSGFVVARDRVMTNAHVVAGVSSPTVTFEDGDVREATVVFFDPAVDVAVLKVEVGNRKALGWDAQAERGEAAVIAGYPKGRDLSFAPARMSGTALIEGTDIYGKRTNPRSVYYFLGQVKQGNSGGPLLNESGLVIGVTFAGAADGSKSGFALTRKQVAEALTAGALASSPVDTGPCLKR